MRRILLPALLLLLGVISMRNASAQTATCQTATVLLDVNGDAALPDALLFIPQVDVNVFPSNGAPETNNVWQSFTPTVSGILDRITLVMENLNAPTGITLTVYSGEGIGGTVLHTQAVPALLIGANVLDINATVNLIAGNLYTFRLNATGGTFFPQRNNMNIYAGGISSIGAAFDLIFTTQMLQRPSIDNGSTSPTGIASFALSNNTFDCENLGGNSVTLTVTAKGGGTDDCVSTVTVEDNIDPTAVCVASTVNVVLDVNGDGVLMVDDVDSGSGDNCSFTRSLSQSVFNCSDVGVNTITLTIEDAASNTATCNVNVDVIDNVPPVALCQHLTVVLDANGEGSITPAMVNDGSTDACGVFSLSLDQEDFDCSHIGANTVTLTVEDVNGNVNSCTATVTVEDNIAPSITCPPSQILCATEGSGALVNYANPLGFDNCNFTIAQTDVTGLSSGSTFPVGTTTLEYTITDDGGNSESCSFNITVDAKPVAGFNFSPACAGEAMFFTNTSTIQAGYSIVSHTWDMGDGSGPVTQVNPLFIYPIAGDYDVTLTVVTADGCTDFITQTVTVTPSPVADFNAAPVCLGATTAFVNLSSIDVSYTGNVDYVWNFGDGSPTSTDENPTHTYATSGTFTVTLTATNDDGCTDQIQKFAIVSALPQAQFTSSSVCEGVATQFTDLSFGTNLSYAWDFGDSNTSADQNPAHIYATSGGYSVSLTVTAPGGCQSFITNNVTVIAPPAVDFSFNDVCAGVDIQFTNASSVGSYGWDFGDNTFSILNNPIKSYPTEGFYDVTLTVLSPQSCSASLTQQVEIFRNPHFTLETTPALCFGGSTGTLFVNPIPPVANFWDISINGGADVTNQFLYTGLPAGNYTVDVVDEFGCLGSGATVIGEPAAPVSIGTPQLTNLLCNGDNSGSLMIAASGGTAPYTFAINGGTPQNDGNFTGLAADDYFVEVIDDNGCSESTQFYTIAQPAPLSLALVTSSNLLCNGDNSGIVSTEASGGTTPYEYSINGGTFGSSPDFTGLAAGLQSVIVRDANGCETPLNVTLTQPGILQVSVINSSNALCNGQATGTVTVAASSGTGPYQYSKDGVNFQGSGSFTGLGAGVHTFIASDVNGCTAEISHTVAEPAMLGIATTSSPVLCFGASSGSISVTATGGTTPYTYSFNGGNSFFSTPVASGLPSGIYTVVVRDANGCETSQSVEVTEAATLLVLEAATTNVSCFEGSNGSVALTASGGTPTYGYSADGVVFQSASTFSGLSAGNYTFTVKDINGCTAETTVEVTEPPTAVAITNVVTNAPACGNTANGAITLQAGGGTPGYTYSSNGVDFQASALLGGLAAGTYTVVVMDANGCTATSTATLDAPPALEITVNQLVGVECAGTFTGTIDVSADGGTPGYTWALSGGTPQSPGIFNELTNGAYIVQLTDANGCNTSIEVELPALFALPAVDFAWVISGEAVWFQNQSQFGDTYLWDFGDGTTSTEESPIHFYAVPGFYTVTLSVTNGCGTRNRIRPVNTLTIGVDDEEKQSFALYPNPASDIVFVTSAIDITGKVLLEVTSVSGQRILQQHIQNMSTNGRISLDVSSLDQGMYLLSVQAEDGRSVIRFNITR